MRPAAASEWWRDPIATGSLVLALVLAGICLDHTFFWDTIQLSSKQASYFYYFPAAFPLLPDVIDSGHPPGFGGYLALWWALLGRSLWVSHLAMVPWLWLLIYQVFRLSQQLSPAAALGLMAGIVLADPVLLGQMVLISPDVAVAGLFLLGVRGLLSANDRYLSAAVLVLSFMSLRGMMVGFALYLADVAFMCSRRAPSGWPNTAFERVFYYLPGGLVGLAFLLFHYQAKGWIGFHPDSPWAPSFARVGLGGFLKNIVIYAWRILDFGRVFVWLALAVALWRHRSGWRRWWQDDTSRLLFFVLAAAVLVLSPTLLTRAGLLNHRYLLPVFLSLGLLVGYVISLLQIRTERISLGVVAVLGLLLGNLWIYPDHIAQGWDSSLAHLPYYQVRKDVLRAIQERGIPLADIGTAFPEIGPLDERDLSGTLEGMSRKDLAQNQYIYYSNVMNDFTDEEMTQLRSSWIPIYTVKKAGIKGVLYQRIKHAKTKPD